METAVTLGLAALLAAMVGTGMARMLALQEREREEAYVRESLADVCAAYADMISIGSSMRGSTNLANQAVTVGFRQETGGVSLETGRVTQVAYVTSMANPETKALELDIYSLVPEGLDLRLSFNARGDAALIPLAGEMVSCTVRPLNYDPETATNTAGFLITDAALGYLEVKARYAVKNKKGEEEERFATAGRMVRLWNRE